MNPYQRTAEWFEARLGCLTASSVADILPNSKGKYRESREALMNVLIAERDSGRARESFTSAAMQWGIDHEEDAREAYQIEKNELVELTGFLLHPSIPYLGASPDGLVGDDGLIEIKCPQPATQIKYIRAGVVPEEYRPQILLQLIVTGRRWCDFVSFDPRARAARFFCVRWEPTEEEKQALLGECVKFLEETAQAYEAIKQY